LFEFTLPDGAVYKTADDQAEHWDGQTVAGALLKSVDERRYTLTMGYPANSLDVGVARDGLLDFASEGEVEKAAWGFIQNPQVGLFHQDGTEGAGTIVESYIYRGPEWSIEAANGSTQVIKSGDWLIGTIWSQAAWDDIKSGRIGGTSMQGSAARRTPSPADVAKVLAKRGR
jgi:hypothetical protein